MKKKSIKRKLYIEITVDTNEWDGYENWSDVLLFVEILRSIENQDIKGLAFKVVKNKRKGKNAVRP